MNNSIIIYLYPEIISDAILKLNEFDEIDLKIPTVEDMPTHDFNKKHSFYNLSVAELSPLIISISSMFTNFAALATAIISVIKEAKKKKQKEEPKLIIKGDVFILKESIKPDELMEFIMKAVR